MIIRITSLSKLCALLLLLEKPRSGYELIGEIRQKFNYPVSAGQIYPFLFSLVHLRFVKSRKIGSRDKKIYTLTPKGKEFANKVVDSFDELVESAISKKVHKCSHCGCKVLGKGHSEKINARQLRFCCASCASTFKKLV